MKDRSDIKKILGLTQNEMGMFLGITRSRWSMFKSGQRDIPLKAKEKLGRYMDALTANKGLCAEREALHKAETQKVHLELQQELRATEMKIIRLAKEIAGLKRIRQELFVAFETSKLLADDKKKGMAEILAKVVRTRVNNSLTKHDLAKLTLLELKKEAAEMLKLQIEAKLKK